MICAASAGGFLAAQTSDWRALAAALLICFAGAGAAVVDAPPDLRIPHSLTYPSIAGALLISLAWGPMAALWAAAAGGAAFLLVWAGRGGGGDMRLAAAGAAIAAAAGAGFGGGWWRAAMWVPVGIMVWLLVAVAAAFSWKIIRLGGLSEDDGEGLKSLRIPAAPGAALGSLAGLAWAASI